MEQIPTVSPSVYRACEAVGRLMDLWGFKRIHGMIWTFIYLKSEPVSALEIKEGLDISAGLTSMTLTDLQRWGVVHRRSIPGERKDFFVTESNLATPILKVLREREYYELGFALNALRDTKDSFSSKETSDSGYAIQQLDNLLGLGESAYALFEQFLDLGIINTRTLQKSKISVPM